MKLESVIATIKGKFDLGYIVELESGGVAQLRLLELKGRELEYHLASKEERLFGEKLPVYITYQDDRRCLVSQFSPDERKQREQIEELKAIAREKCEIGNVFDVEVEKSYEWGYLCREVGGYLHGAIKKPTQKGLSIGQKVAVVVVSKNAQGAPYFDVKE